MESTTTVTQSPAPEGVKPKTIPTREEVLIQVLALVDEHPHRADRLLGAVAAIRNYDGNTTPVEDLIDSLLLHYGNGRILEPEHVRGIVSEFEASFGLMVENTSYAVKNYPRLFNDQAEKVRAA